MSGGEKGPAYRSQAKAADSKPALVSEEDRLLQESLASLRSSAVNFSQRFIQTAKVRENYIRQAEAASQEILDEIRLGRITARQGGQEANELRNALLNAARINDSDIGRAIAEVEKASGLTLEQLETKYAKKLFNKDFTTLSAAEQDAVYIEITFKAGKPNPNFNRIAKFGGKVGKGLLIASLAFAVYNVAQSDRPGREATKEGVGLGVGFLGSVGGGAAAGAFCGPGAPICVGVGALVGGIAFAVGADLTFDWLWE